MLKQGVVARGQKSTTLKHQATRRLADISPRIALWKPVCKSFRRSSSTVSVFMKDIKIEWLPTVKYVPVGLI